MTPEASPVTAPAQEVPKLADISSKLAARLVVEPMSMEAGTTARIPSDPPPKAADTAGPVELAPTVAVQISPMAAKAASEAPEPMTKAAVPDIAAQMCPSEATPAPDAPLMPVLMDFEKVLRQVHGLTLADLPNNEEELNLVLVEMGVQSALGRVKLRKLIRNANTCE